mmetsp:Transcript_7268/g.11437  ORF Transcript_7268/g.11437 Transcript_7268/m.11437 type:complete len:1695 (-) Transcript_7268:113-5197(-)
MSSSAEAMARFHAALAAVAAASSSSSSTTTNPASSSTTTSRRSSSTTTTEEEDGKPKSTNPTEEQEDDEEDITYTPYKPAKLSYGRPHPDKVVENSTLSAVAPPDITYNVVMPANIIYEGKLSNSQLEAIVYGCQRHMVDLPKPTIVTKENDAPEASAKMAAAAASAKVKSEKKKKGLQVQAKHDSKPQDDSPSLSPCPPNGTGSTDQSSVGVARKKDPPSYRAGFLLGDGAGMGKGRTLAGFVVENIARGRTKHVWVSVSSDLYEDAKRDLSDLGLESYAENNCFNLGKLPYGSLLPKGKGRGKKAKGKKGKKRKNDEVDGDPYAEGVMFSTYSTLVAKKNAKDTRRDQLIEWCGGDNPEEFDGLIMFDECHKAKTVELDADGNPTDKSSKTAQAVVEIQKQLPRARVVYCSATSVSEPKNLGFMSRLGLWGYGTEHPLGFGQFLEGIKRLGTGAMELHAMHLKSVGAIVARTLSYEACEFELLDNVSDESVRKIYNDAANLWIDLHSHLADRVAKLKKEAEIKKKIKLLLEKQGGQGLLSDEQLFYQGMNEDSDDEGEQDEDEDEDDPLIIQRKLRRKFRDRKPGILKGLFWSSHQRFFRTLCIASKVDTAISTAQKALADGHCCVIGLQSTGESRAKGAAKIAGLADEGGSFGEAFVSAPNEDLKRTIMQMFPLPPKPAGVIAPEFLNHLKKEDIIGDDGTVDDTASVSTEDSFSTLDSSRPSRRKKKAVSYDETNVSSEGVILNLEEKVGAKNKSGKKHKSSSSDSSLESEYRDLLSDSDSDSNDDFDVFDLKKKKTPTQTIPWNEIPLDSNEKNMCVADRIEFKRKADYRRAAEKVKGWLDTVDSLSLPANPLDRLLNELGGPDQVAELTGRKSRQIKQYNAMTDKFEVIYEKRKGEGRLDQINIEEKNNFQNGSKLVAILSEAASTGISLQADKRVKNQRRRVHITIELPWSADKAIQQLGRTHRSNQTTGPLYKFLISDVGGEKRFASAVAKRLALLGALTQGDRRATGSANSLGLSTFDMDNQYGSNALHKMLKLIWTCSSNEAIDNEVDDSLYAEALKMIDGHLKEAIDAEERGEGTLEENLEPFDDDTEGEKTFRSMMYHLLTGPCEKLTSSRVTAIKDGRSVSEYFESLAGGLEDKESIKLKIDDEIKSALDAGLNFNVLCNIWLFDVGVSQNELLKESEVEGKKRKSRTPFGVAKFLNRLLGMNMKRQGLVFDLFVKTLDAEIRSAKSSGSYDLGIKTMKGQSVTFIQKPQSFVFRGLTAPDETVELYAVQQDKGLTSEKIMEMYNDLKDSNNDDTNSSAAANNGNADSSDQDQGWFGTRRTRKFNVKTGFYVDNRDYLTKTHKVFFIHNPGDHNDKCIVARPNLGSYTENKDSLKAKFNRGVFTQNPVSVQRAMEIWDREYELADIPYSDHYQKSCRGRHRESYVFAGGIVPILNKILRSGRYYGDNEKMKRPFNVVRVEVTNAAVLNADMIQQPATPEEIQDEDVEMLQADPVVGDEEDIGKGVARELANKTSKVRFRGAITKYHDNDKNSHLDPTGSYFVKFSDGRKLEMDADQVNHARRKFEKEVNRLVSVGMPREDASSTEEQTKLASLAKTKLRKPILQDGEEDPEEFERHFEQEYTGLVPDAVVGLEFWRDGLHEVVLQNLSEELLQKGVETTRSLHNLEKLERAEAQGKEDEKM